MVTSGLDGVDEISSHVAQALLDGDFIFVLVFLGADFMKECRSDYWLGMNFNLLDPTLNRLPNRHFILPKRFEFSICNFQ